MARVRKSSKKQSVKEVEPSMELSPTVSDIEDDSDVSETMSEENGGSEQKAKEHVQQLQRLQEKDPEFYQFLQEHDKDLLDFNDASIHDESEAEPDEVEPQDTSEEIKKPTASVIITTAMVDSWCNSIRANRNLGAVRSLMRAFRTACHYGDEGDAAKFSVMSGSVFNKIMLFVLNEMDGVLRDLLKLPSSGGKKETIVNLMGSKGWKNYGNLVKSYLGNSLHVLNQMTDTQMISFTLRRLRYSTIFLAAFQNLLRKYIKVALHFWGTGGGALPVVSFLFLRDVCIRLGSDCLDPCLKGIYKAYVLNCQFVNASKLQHIQFLGNCVAELYGVELPSAYQHAFIFIRQLAMILRDALTEKTKVAFRKVYNWKFIHCLELWTGIICAYQSEPDFKPLAYPLMQIISGVARLVPTARYFPLRLRCARMLNRIAASTSTFIPVCMLLLDMLEMKELNRPPTGGVGIAVDLRTTLKVSKMTLKTRSFQESCVFSVIEEIAEHLAQWSYSVAFLELSFIPLVRLRSFCKSTKVDRFRKEIREFVRQVEASSEFINTRRLKIAFSPSDPAVASFLEVEKESKASPLSRFAVTLRVRAQQRNDSMVKSSVLVGENSSMFTTKISEIDEDNENVEEGIEVFNSSWLPGKNSRIDDGGKNPKEAKKVKKREPEVTPGDEDLVEELVLSSDEDEDEPVISFHSIEQGKVEKSTPAKRKSRMKNQRPSNNRGPPRAKKLKMRSQ